MNVQVLVDDDVTLLFVLNLQRKYRNISMILFVLLIDVLILIIILFVIMTTVLLLTQSDLSL